MYVRAKKGCCGRTIQLAVWKEAGPIPQRGGSYGVSRQSTHSLASRGPGSAASSMHGSTAGARSLQGASNKPKPQLLRHLTPGMSFGDVGTLNRIPRCARASVGLQLFREEGVGIDIIQGAARTGPGLRDGKQLRFPLDACLGLRRYAGPSAWASGEGRLDVCGG
jgi:hypothetical protein